VAVSKCSGAMSARRGARLAANIAKLPELLQRRHSMQPILDHIDTVIRPALRKYVIAERELTDALASQRTDAIITARQEVMLAARLAADVLHHLSDFVFKEPSSELMFAKVEDVRSAVEAKCVFLRTLNVSDGDAPSPMMCAAIAILWIERQYDIGETNAPMTSPSFSNGTASAVRVCPSATAARAIGSAPRQMLRCKRMSTYR
jgi:hypothetical protein